MHRRQTSFQGVIEAMFNDQAEYLNAFKGKEGQSETPTLSGADAEMDEYKKAFGALPDAHLGSGLYGIEQTGKLINGVGENSPTELSNTAPGTGDVLGTTEGSEKPQDQEKKPLMATQKMQAPDWTPDHSADQYLSAFNDFATQDAADRSAKMRDDAKASADLAGK